MLIEIDFFSIPLTINWCLVYRRTNPKFPFQLKIWFKIIQISDNLMSTEIFLTTDNSVSMFSKCLKTNPREAKHWQFVTISIGILPVEWKALQNQSTAVNNNCFALRLCTYVCILWRIHRLIEPKLVFCHCECVSVWQKWQMPCCVFSFNLCLVPCGQRLQNSQIVRRKKKAKIVKQSDKLKLKMSKHKDKDKNRSRSRSRSRDKDRREKKK